MTRDILRRKAIREGIELCSQCAGTGECVYLSFGQNDETLEVFGECNRCHGRLFEPTTRTDHDQTNPEALEAAVAAMDRPFGRKASV